MELLVSVAVLSILGVIFLVVFSNSLKGGNKAQIVLAIKQNGQSVLENMDKTIRGADNIICVTNDTLVIEKNGEYTRYYFVAESSSANGQIQQDNPNPEIMEISSDPPTICVPPLIDPVALTDTNTKTGVSVTSGSFTKDKPAGFKDVITIKFDIAQGVEVTPGTSSVIDPIHFETSIQLR